MKFDLIDVATWHRKEYFEHYLKNSPCTYSMCFNVDITLLLPKIQERQIKLYPTLIYVLSTIVNKHEEFRTALDSDGNVGIFDVMHPVYAIFQKDSETFTNIWTPYSPDFSHFFAGYTSDTQKYGSIKKLFSKPDMPPNVFTISSIPWVDFTGFNLNIPKAANYLIPIFTMGKFFKQDEKIKLPMAIQVHHAVCDGFHLGRFIMEMQEFISTF